MWIVWPLIEKKLVKAMHNPSHAGSIVKRQCLEPLGEP